MNELKILKVAFKIGQKCILVKFLKTSVSAYYMFSFWYFKIDLPCNTNRVVVTDCIMWYKAFYDIFRFGGIDMINNC